MTYSWNGETNTSNTCYNEAIPLAYPNIVLTKSNPAYGIQALNIPYLSSSGGIYFSKNIGTGTKFTATGCSIAGSLGGSTVGSFIREQPEHALW